MDAKPFFIVLLFVFIVAMIASGIIGNVNLTDSGTTQPPSTSSNGVNNTFLGGSSSSSLPSAAGSGVTAGQPITGILDGKSTLAQNSPCGSTYTVQSGDTLSQVARTCLVSIEDLLAVNPSITNPNLITVGQKITIFRVIPVVTLQPAAFPTAIPTIVQAATKVATVSPVFSATIPAGSKAGAAINIEARGFPVSAEVQIGIGKTGIIPTIVKTMLTDENGEIHTSINIPKSAKAADKWTVTITTTKSPRKKITVVPFVIGK